MLMEAVVTFVAAWLLITHIPPRTMRWVVRHKGWFDWVLHVSVIYLFCNSFEGLMQAEFAAIMFSVYLRVTAKYYEHLDRVAKWAARIEPTN